MRVCTCVRECAVRRPVWVTLCVLRGGPVGVVGQPAGRPGALGVRPLTGSVAGADGRGRQGAETSVAHAADCSPRKGLWRHRSSSGLVWPKMQEPGWHSGSLVARCSEKSPTFVPQSHTAAPQVQGATVTEPGLGWDLGGFTGLRRRRPQLA